MLSFPFFYTFHRSLAAGCRTWGSATPLNFSCEAQELPDSLWIVCPVVAKISQKTTYNDLHSRATCLVTCIPSLALHACRIFLTNCASFSHFLRCCVI